MVGVSISSNGIGRRDSKDNSQAYASGLVVNRILGRPRRWNICAFILAGRVPLMCSNLSTDIGTWLVSIIKGKVTMHRFE